METTGLDGHTTMVVGFVEDSITPGPGRAGVGALEADPGHGHVVAEPHEVLLEPDLGSVGQLHPGAERIVGDRQQADGDARTSGPARR